MTVTDELSAQHDDHHELLAAGFALDALEPSERNQFNALMRSCSVCARLASEYRSVAGLLPYSLEPMEASPGLRQRVLDAATATTPTAAAAAPPPPRTGLGQAPWAGPTELEVARRKRGLFWALPFAALFAAVLGLGYWNYRLQQTVNEQAALIQSHQEVVEAIAAGGPQWSLAGTPSAPTASGVLLVDRGARPILLVHGLPELEPRQAYQAWVITGGVPVGAGLLRSDGRGGQHARLDRPLGSADTVAVTIEPATGSASPTGPIVVAGNL
jgi:anti-sigma-K factor RskA